MSIFWESQCVSVSLSTDVSVNCAQWRTVSQWVAVHQWLSVSVQFQWQCHQWSVARGQCSVRRWYQLSVNRSRTSLLVPPTPPQGWDAIRINPAKMRVTIQKCTDKLILSSKKSKWQLDKWWKLQYWCFDFFRVSARDAPVPVLIGSKEPKPMEPIRTDWNRNRNWSEPIGTETGTDWNRNRNR